MVRIVVLSLFAIMLYAQNFTSIESVRTYLQNLSPKEKLELALIQATESNRIKEAKFILTLLNASLHYPKGQFFENILMMPPQSSAIVVDKHAQQLYLLKNSDNNVTIEKFPCITGKKPGDKLQKGDQRTPNGIYFTKSFIDPQHLSEIYGNGAFPLNYPNIIDRAFFKKSGSGIWLHATNDDNRPPNSSNGCVVVTNTIFDQLKPQIRFKQTPIVIVEKVSFTDQKSYEKERLSLAYFLYRWKKAWEGSVNGRAEEYLALYSEHMVSPYGPKQAFSRHKRAVARNKRWISLELDNILLAKDGRVLDFGHIYVASFDLYYRSNNYTWNGKKILYIVKEDGQWKILAEESF